MNFFELFASRFVFKFNKPVAYGFNRFKVSVHSFQVWGFHAAVFPPGHNSLIFTLFYGYMPGCTVTILGKSAHKLYILFKYPNTETIILSFLWMKRLIDR
jgi:hypothetical protein